MFWHIWNRRLDQIIYQNFRSSAEDKKGCAVCGFPRKISRSYCNGISLKCLVYFKCPLIRPNKICDIWIGVRKTYTFPRIFKVYLKYAGTKIIECKSKMYYQGSDNHALYFSTCRGLKTGVIRYISDKEIWTDACQLKQLKHSRVHLTSCNW